MKLTIINMEGIEKTIEIPKCLEKAYLREIDIESTWIVEK